MPPNNEPKRDPRPVLRSEVCKERRWHRVRYVGDDWSSQKDAACIDCGETGSTKWAIPHLLKEHSAEKAEVLHVTD